MQEVGKKVAVPREILGLVERFERNREAYRSGRYNETQVRVDFIDPFMALLGWDTHNRQDRPVACLDVRTTPPSVVT